MTATPTESLFLVACRAARQFALLVFLAVPGLLKAQFICTTNNLRITITGYTGSGGAVTIPFLINNWPVVSIGDEAFNECTNVTSITMLNTVITNIGEGAFDYCWTLTNVTLPTSLNSIGDGAFYRCTALPSITIPNSVTNIGEGAFEYCSGLSSITIGSGVLNITDEAFEYCWSLTSVTIPNSVTSIGFDAFAYCWSTYTSGLTNVTIGNSVTNIGQGAFSDCGGLAAVFFKGNVPTAGDGVFEGDAATIYYLPGTTGWASTFPGIPIVMWNPQVLTSTGRFGVWANIFGFSIIGTGNIPIMVEACTNLASPVWLPVQTFTLTNGFGYFSDTQWTNYSNRFYQIGMP